MGLALLFGALDVVQPSDGWDSVAHEHLEEAVRGLGASRHMGLFAGLAGVGVVAQELSAAERAIDACLPGLTRRSTAG